MSEPKWITCPHIDDETYHRDSRRLPHYATLIQLTPPIKSQELDTKGTLLRKGDYLLLCPHCMELVKAHVLEDIMIKANRTR